MNLSKLFLTIVIVSSGTFCFSQKADSTYYEQQSLNLKASYNSSLIYPGARLGIEIPVKTIHFTGMKKKFVKDRFITANISWYHHPNFHDNVYLTSGWTMRRTKSKGFFSEFSPELGVSRTFLGGTTYKVDNNGNATIEKFAGYYYAFVSAGGGIGYDFSKTKSKPFMVFTKLNLFLMFPYNSTIYLRPAMEIGLIYRPHNWGTIKTKARSINKNPK